MSIVIRLILIALFCTFFVVGAIADGNSEQVCKVIKINRSNKKTNGTDRAYIILLQDTVTHKYYTTVSVKNNLKTSLKIKVGEFYAFKLYNYFKYDYVVSIGNKLLVIVEDVFIDIPFSHYTANIYTTPNLKGIYYISSCEVIEK